VRLLRELSRHGSELSATAFAARARLSKRIVSASLAHLSELGCIESIGGSRRVPHRIDNEHPLAAAITRRFFVEDRRFQSP